MQARHQKYCYIKLWRIIKFSRAFNIFWILFYCGLYTMAIDIVTWRTIKKWCIWSLRLRNFLWLPVIALFLRKLRQLSHNYLNFIYIFLKLIIGTEKCIRPKWVFLPQWQWTRLLISPGDHVALQWHHSLSDVTVAVITLLLHHKCEILREV